MLADGYSAAYFRKKPMLYVAGLSRATRQLTERGLLRLFHRDDDDYDIDFYTADPLTIPDPLDTQKQASNREHLEVRDLSLFMLTHHS